MTAPRIVVTRGNPTDAELAALTAALAHDRARAAAQDDEPEPALSPWIRAARLEACGHPPIDSPARLHTHR